MIVHRIWFRRRFKMDYLRGYKREVRRREMEGWFLFGILPLYIRTRKIDEWDR